MKMYKQCMIGLAMVGMIGFAGCKDDDPSMEEQFSTVRDNYNDLLLDPNISWYVTMYEPVYGKVKSIEETYYTTSWDATNKKVNVGDPNNRFLTEYNPAGFKTLEKTFELITPADSEVKKFRVRSSIEYTLDSRNRQIEAVERNVTYESGTSEVIFEEFVTYKTTTAYDDAKKEATVLEYRWDRNSEEFTLISKTVYKLMDNGRIDYNSHTTYQKSETDDDMDKLSYSREIVTERDSHKNWIVFYFIEKIYNNNGELTNTYSYEYRTRDFVYY